MNEGTTIYAQGGSATSAAIPSNTMPIVGEQVQVTISIDATGVAAPNGALGSFTGALDWDPAVLAYSGHSGILAGFSGVVNDADASAGHIIFNGANAEGAQGNTSVLRIAFEVLGAGTSDLALEYSAMSAASSFVNLLPILTVSDGHVRVSPARHYSLTIALDGAKGGRIDPEVGVHIYPEGTVIDIAAIPDASYEFDHWGGACAGSGTCQVTMDADKSVTAYLAELQLACYPLTISHEGQGSEPVADPTSSTGCPASRYLEGEIVHLTSALPDTGWQISGWRGTSGDLSSAGFNSLTMPARDHAVSVVYEVNRIYNYLPITIVGETDSELTPVQTGGDPSESAGTAPSSEDDDVSGDTFPEIPSQEIIEEQALAPEPTVVEDEEAIAAVRSSSEPGGLETKSAAVPTQEIANVELNVDCEYSTGNDSTLNSSESLVDGALSVIGQPLCLLPVIFVLLVLVALAVSIAAIIGIKFRSSE